jgi:hypothetical protein
MMNQNGYASPRISANSPIRNKKATSVFPTPKSPNSSQSKRLIYEPAESKILKDAWKN